MRDKLAMRDVCHSHWQQLIAQVLTKTLSEIHPLHIPKSQVMLDGRNFSLSMGGMGDDEGMMKGICWSWEASEIGARQKTVEVGRFTCHVAFSRDPRRLLSHSSFALRMSDHRAECCMMSGALSILTL